MTLKSVDDSGLARYLDGDVVVSADFLIAVLSFMKDALRQTFTRWRRMVSCFLMTVPTMGICQQTFGDANAMLPPDRLSEQPQQMLLAWW